MLGRALMLSCTCALAACAARRPPAAPVARPATLERAAPQPLRRLTRAEYDHTVRDLLGDTSRPAQVFPPEGPGGSGFATAGLMSAIDVERAREAAEAVARRAAGKLAWFVPCDVARAGERGCADRFIAELGLRAFRRPLLVDEAAALRALYDEARREPGATHADGLRVVLEAMLQAPQFLYHWEGASGGDPSWRVAARLSYFVWRTMPDDRLFARAAAHALARSSDVEGEARRLLADARARDMVADFHTQWLRLGALASLPKDPKRFPEYSPELAGAMLAETQRFATEVILDGDGRLETLLTARWSFVNRRLARLYGLAVTTDERDGAGPELRRVELPPSTERRGLLTHASVLASGANAYDTYPHLRGKLIREQLLCGQVPPPPPQGVPPLPRASQATSTRERFEEHRLEGACARCHRLMDDIGFGLERFDAIGRLRATDGGKPVDTSGTIAALDGRDVAFRDTGELLATLAGSETVRRCVARQWFRFAVGREERAGDAASIDAAYAAFARAGYDVRELIVAIATTPAFLAGPAGGGP